MLTLNKRDNARYNLKCALKWRAVPPDSKASSQAEGERGYRKWAAKNIRAVATRYDKLDIVFRLRMAGMYMYSFT